MRSNWQQLCCALTQIDGGSKEDVQNVEMFITKTDHKNQNLLLQLVFLLLC
jgi:hypothetical protein